ncbi:hypothetical protein KUTeg_003861 [Tegillarca granosa]|uniref:Uncharacterized protein n=1 Tax=Tegillarca granosa TaxID=220873 RepID=A0ABQ9FND6_TEGGR|nr:hypothetical protein KUTeg_003861 [Tegillarca granosa]
MMADSTEVISIDMDAVFDPEPDRKYICPICLGVLKDPMQTSCGHRFCHGCISGIVNGRVNVKCPVDNMRIKTGELFEDNAFRREVMSLCVKCNNYRQGCLWTGEWRNLQDHLNICDFIYVRCQYGCGLSLLKQTQNDHEAICERRPVECQDCHIQIAFADLTKHQVLICQNFLVQCAVCGQGGLKRKEISNHTDVNKGDCPETVVPCQYTALGCQHQVTY